MRVDSTTHKLRRPATANMEMELRMDTTFGLPEDLSLDLDFGLGEVEGEEVAQDLGISELEGDTAGTLLDHEPEDLEPWKRYTPKGYKDRGHKDKGRGCGTATCTQGGVVGGAGAGTSVSASGAGSVGRCGLDASNASPATERTCVKCRSGGHKRLAGEVIGCPSGHHFHMGVKHSHFKLWSTFNVALYPGRDVVRYRDSLETIRDFLENSVEHRMVPGRNDCLDYVEKELRRV